MVDRKVVIYKTGLPGKRKRGQRKKTDTSIISLGPIRRNYNVNDLP